MTYEAFFEYYVEWQFLYRKFLESIGEFECAFDAEHAPPDDIDDTQYVRPRGWVP